MDDERELDFNDILITAALRLDPSKSGKRHAVDPVAAQETYEQTGNWSHLDIVQQMAVFYTHQRYLYKWGGEMLSRRSLIWRGFIELFLLTCRVPVPQKLRHPEYHDRWTTRYLPRLDECIALVTAVYQGTDYADRDFMDDEIAERVRPRMVDQSE